MMFPILLSGRVLLVMVLVVMVIARRTSVAGFDELARTPMHVGWSVLIAVVALNVFAYNRDFGIGFGLFGACTIAAILLVFPPVKRSHEAWFLALTGIAACILFGFRANEFVQIVNMATALVCAGMLVLLRSVDTLRWHGLWFLKMKVGFLERFLRQPFALGAAARSARTAGDVVFFTILKTGVITLIVLFFFAGVLSAADPVFDALIREIRDQLFGRAFLSGILIAFLLSLLTVSVPAAWQENVPRLKILSFVEMFVPALALALLFGLFLGVQTTYLFGTHADFQTLGITYADYVRRGFVELLVASFAGSIISYALILKQHALAEAGRILKLKWVNGVLLAELLLLLMSAAKRDWMYVEMYGLTRVRIIGAVFLLWLLTIIVLIIALNFFRTMTERRLFSWAAIASAAVVLSLNVVNIDAIVALSSPPRGGRPDIVYMSRLSSDAAEGWLAALTEAHMRYESLRTKTAFSEQEKTELADAKIALASLDERITRLSDPRPWQEWNWSRVHALRRINESGFQPSVSGLIACLRGGIREVQLRTGTDLSAQEEHRITDYHSPFIFDGSAYQPESLDTRGTLPSGGSSSAPPSCVE